MNIQTILLNIIFICYTQAYKKLEFLDDIKNLGYQVAIYNNVTTSDGYVLTLFRINKEGLHFKGVVYMVHGLSASGSYWFMNERNKTLPLLLANDGYDVWVGNLRGTLYTLKHARWDYNEPFGPFWNFSFHEIGLYDLPASIDFILNTTKCKNLTYIGHSQGTTEFFVMTSLLPEYNKKINLMVSLGTVIFLNNSKAPFWLLNTIKQIFPGFPIFGVLVNAIGDILGELCKRESFRQIIVFLLFSFNGYDYEGLNMNRVVRFSSEGHGVSSKEIIHYVQLRDSASFRQYDYSPLENLKYYGSREPPRYDLSKVSTKVLLYTAKNDFFSAVEDVEMLHRRLPNSEMIFINFTSFNHLDYLMGKYVNEAVYDSIRNRVAGVEGQC